MSLRALVAEFAGTDALATLDAAKPVNNPIAGIVGDLSVSPRRPGEPDVAYTVAIGTDAARIALPDTGVSFVLSASGVGFTHDRAAARAVGEVVERYAATHPDPSALVDAAWSELCGPHPREYALFSDAQHAEGLPYRPFDSHTHMEWVRATDLTCQGEAWVPAGLVYLVRPERPWRVSIGPATSTGLACARTKVAATLAGLLEAIERDAFTLTWLRRLPTAPVVLPDEGPLRRLIQRRFLASGLDFLVRLLPTDLGVYVMLVMVLDAGADRAVAAVGAAAHLDPSAALLKALLEAVQTRAWLLEMGGGAGFDPGPDFANVRRFKDHVLLYGQPRCGPLLRFLMDTPAPSLRLEDLPDLHHGSHDADVEYCVGRLRVAGLKPVAVTLTPPDLAACGFEVVKVLAPGLLGIAASHRFRFLGGQRLWEVPSRLGLGVARSVNPDPHPFP